MSEKLSVIVRVSPERLPNSERWSLDSRKSLVEQALTALRSQFADITFGPPNATACTVAAKGEFDAIAKLLDFLERHPQVGKSLVDGPIVGFAEDTESAKVN